VRLYHFTCSHAAPRIRTARWLVPHPQVVLGGCELIWLTDMDVPERLALGLTSYTLRCDRTEVRVTVVTAEAKHWPTYARTVEPAQRRQLDFADGALPMHWWVADAPVPVLEVQ